MDPRKRRRLLGRLITGLVVLIVAGLITYGFVPKPVPVLLGKVQKRALEITVDEVGRTRIRSRYVISAPVLGNLSRITLEVGDTVEAGDVLASISPMTPLLLDQRTRSEASARVGVAGANVERAKAMVQRAEVALAYARDQAERARSLRASQGTSAQSLEAAEFQLRAAEEDASAAQLAAHVAEHELGMARTTLQSLSPGAKASPGLTVTAPTSGRVLRVLKESAGVVQPGTPLLELGDPAALQVVTDVLTTQAVRIQIGSPARIERWGGPTALQARVRKKEPSAFTTRSALGVEEQRVPVVLDIMDRHERWATLGDGYRVETHIRTGFIDGAMAAPASAVFRDGPVWAAFRVEQGHAHKVQLTLGERTPDWVEVKRGLSIHDVLVLYPSDQVRDGVEVKAQ